ncbi:hypothetical protein ACQEVG_21455 [Streptomyces sp. CA-135486]|uniref:hypothetical protein n=1 Tax=Streptomyces sp. CA-135486 TaxID=3240049 RepID=UPI003D8B8CF9
MYRQVELPLGLDEQNSGQDENAPTLDDRFEDFHAEHPWVYEALERLTSRWVASGGGRIGVKALFEQLRWIATDLAHGESFQLNNSFTSRYARLLRARHPEWRDVFELRRLRVGEHDGEYSTLDDNDQVK